MPDYFSYLLLFALIVLVLFLIFREATMWYWKINLRTDLLRQILVELKEIKRGMRKSPDDKKKIETPENPTSLKNVKMSSLSSSNMVKCPYCKKRVPLPSDMKESYEITGETDLVTCKNCEKSFDPKETEMFCPVCNKEIKFIDRFCRHCKSNLDT